MLLKKTIYKKANGTIFFDGNEEFEKNSKFDPVIQEDVLTKCEINVIL